MKNQSEMYSFSSKLWYNKRCISKKTGDASIYIQVTINRVHDEFPLKLRWPADKIDLDKGELVRRRKPDPDVDDYNLLIKIEQAKHTEILRTYRLRKAHIDMDKFKSELMIFDNRESFSGFMFRFNRQRYEDKLIERKTFQNIRSTVKLMMEFDMSWRYDTLCISFMDRFKAFLRNKEYHKSKNYTPGQIWTKIRDVKSHMEFASKEPMVYINQDVISYPNPEPEWETTFLNRDEIGRLIKVYNSEPLNGPDYQILSAFLFTCFTSLRISDVYRINSEWVIGESFIKFIPKKNYKKRKSLTIPIMPLAMNLILNLKGKYFELPSQQEYNRTLKQLAKTAGIHKKLTSHVGRHTFGFLFMTTIGNLKALQEILGHTKIATTERYAHLDEDYKLESVKQMQGRFTDLLMWKAK
ncbi:site-specific integrase [Mucilaginibacter sp. CSA2-8R]|uniref:site-specific integrase n=1 Tax=Mucilaginibacter sp. CSA2-8R TaxID=3141542 RepID=UPI00315D361D